MSDSSSCLNAQASLEEIRSLKQEFDTAYDLAISLGKPEDILKTQELKLKLSKKTQALQERVNTSLAPEIMGRNFLGIFQVEEHLGILTSEQKEALATIPFSLETLRECADTHVLVADIGTSILDLKRKFMGQFRNEQDWYEGQDFSKPTQDTRWRLIRKTPVEESYEKNWNDQQALIDPDIEEIPSARQVVYTIILHFLVTGKRLFDKVFVRTNDADLIDHHISVGLFDWDGLAINRWHDIQSYDALGLLSVRKVS